MRLQNKVYEFTLPGGDKPISRLLTSNLVVNGKQSDMILSELFYGIKKEKNNTIKGYSILEFLDEKGNIQVNDKIYNLSFLGSEETFILKSATEPKDYTLNDKEMTEEETKQIENKIEASAPSEVPTQPLEVKTEEEIPQVGAETSLFENEEYEQEKSDLKEEGFTEYLTEPKSNIKALVNQEEGKREKIVLIEIHENDYEILDLDEYEIELDNKNKTFTVRQLTDKEEA